MSTKGPQLAGLAHSQRAKSSTPGSAAEYQTVIPTILAQAARDGYPYARIDGVTIRLSGQDTPWADKRAREVELVVDWFEVPGYTETLLDDFITRLARSVDRALDAGAGVVALDVDGEKVRLARRR